MSHLTALVGLRPQVLLCISWDFCLTPPWEPNLLQDETR